MTLTEFEQLTVDKAYLGEPKNGLQLMSLETKDGQIHNFYLPKDLLIAEENA